MLVSTQDEHYGVDAIRWYVITLVSLANILNNYLWATWGPISHSVQLVYGWSQSTLFWVINAGNITGFLAVFVGMYLVDVKGIRFSMIICTATMLVSSATRIITLDHQLATILITVGQALNGIATSIISTLPCVVSQTWFQVSERTTAIAISALSAALGAAAAFLFGPLTVSMPEMNGTVIIVNETDVPLINTQMRHLHYISFGVSALLAVCCIIYLPSKPKLAPSKTAALNKYSFKEGIKTVFCSRAMWQITAVYGIPLGFYGNWRSILAVIIGSYGISQDEAGWLSFYGSLIGVIAGCLMGRFADHIQRKTKMIVIVLYVAAALIFAWFTCMCIDILPKSKVYFYITLIISVVCVNCASPLFLVLACETSYPVGEGVTAGFLSMIVNLGATIFMCIELIPNLDTDWANWSLVGVFIAAVPGIIMFKEEYKKIDIDCSVYQPLS